jgi:hypothetical protein
MSMAARDKLVGFDAWDKAQTYFNGSATSTT